MYAKFISLCLCLITLWTMSFAEEKFTSITNATHATNRTSKKLPDGYPAYTLPERSNEYGKQFFDPGDAPVYSDSDPAYSGRFENPSTPPYNIPSSFDQFMPGGLPAVPPYGAAKFNQKPSGYFLTYPSDDIYGYAGKGNFWNMDSSLQRPWKGYPLTSDKMKSMMIKMMDTIGNMDGTSSSGALTEMERPGFLSLVKNTLSQPLTIFLAIAVPFTLLLAAIFPILAKMIAHGEIFPNVTTTIASGKLARQMDVNGPLTVVQILEAVNKLGIRSLENPKCVQKMICQALKTEFDENNGHSLSYKRILRKAANVLDDKFIHDTGIKELFVSLEDGDCEKIHCSSDELLGLENTLNVVRERLINTITGQEKNK